MIHNTPLRYFSLLIVAVAALVWLSVQTTSTAYACSWVWPPAGEPIPPIDFVDRVAQADFIFEGTVTAIEQDVTWHDQYTFQVDRYFKGVGTTQVMVDYFGDDAVCLVNYPLGQTGLWYVFEDEDGWHAYYHPRDYGPTALPRDEVTPENIQFLIDTTGQEPVPPTDSIPTAVALSDMSQTEASNPITLLVITAVAMLAVGLIRLVNPLEER